MLYCLAFTLEMLIWRFSGCLSVKLRTDSYSYWCKSNTQSTSWCLVWSLTDGDVYTSIHFAHIDSRGLHQVPRESSAVMDQEGGYWNDNWLITPCIYEGHSKSSKSYSDFRFVVHLYLICTLPAQKLKQKFELVFLVYIIMFGVSYFHSFAHRDLRLRLQKPTLSA